MSEREKESSADGLVTAGDENSPAELVTRVQRAWTRNASCFFRDGGATVVAGREWRERDANETCTSW